MLSNGRESPLFLAKRQHRIHLRKTDFKKNMTVAKVRGTNNKSKYVVSIHFEDKDGNEIASLIPSHIYPLAEHKLEEGEELIGVYGNKDHFEYFANLGFIVWRPPKN